jgi:hypothetical protein
VIKSVDLGYIPRPWQQRLHKEKKRFSIAVCHRRAGKSYAAMMELIHCALIKPKQHLGYIAPFLNQARKVMWIPLREMAVKIPMTEIRESDLSVTFANGSMIRCMGSDNADSIRGLGLDGVVADEFQMWEQTVLPAVVMPTLAGRNGWLMLLGTPTGIDPLTETYDRASTDPTWAAWKFTVMDTGVLTEEEIAIQKSMCVGNAFRLEWMCDFDAGSPAQLITGDLVKEAMLRQYDEAVYKNEARIMACDIARQGDDRSVIARRQGLQLWDLEAWQEADLMVSARRIRDAYYAFKPDALFIDGGGIGAGVVDALREMGIPVIEVQFGAKALDERFANMRAEMWYNMANWIRRGGRLPPDQDLKLELTSPTYFQNDHGKLQLESKADLKKRGMRSPDRGDAAALTHSMPVHPKSADKDLAPIWDWDPLKA